MADRVAGAVRCRVLLEVAAGLIIGGSSLLVAGMVHQAKTPAQAMGHPVRRSLVEAIQHMPGAKSSALRRVVAANRGTANYHLTVLVRVGAVQVLRQEHSTRYYPADLDPGTLPLMAVLLRGRLLDVARAIIAKPHISQQDLTRDLGISRKVFREYADLLGERDLLIETRRNRRQCYVADRRLEQLVHDLDAASGQNDKRQVLRSLSGGPGL